LSDSNKLAEEEARLRSLSNILNAAGYDPMLYDDFADELFELMRKVANGLHDGTAEDILLQSFNDEMVQNYIITHFRVRYIVVDTKIIH
jgi:ubiquitin thioesterase protein OTUB1